MPTGGELPHRRYNPLADRWVLVSPQRTRRPWQGEQEPAPALANAYEPDCYLCPGNLRANGETNPDYSGVHVFDNDFPALLDQPGATGAVADALFRSQPVRGRCRVICYSPQHNQSLGDLPLAGIEAVIDAWGRETGRLHESFTWVQVFENRGAAMGCSNPHPHGQIWALDHLPVEAAVEDRQQRQYLEAKGAPLLLDYVERECAEGERVILQNEHWAVMVPWWATWPFETLLLPRRSLPTWTHLHTAERTSLAVTLQGLIQGYDRLFATPFPYSMGWHGAPAGEVSGRDPKQHWQLHAHFYPPLLRSASVRKHMVGFEMLAEPQRDISPEQAAGQLRDALIGVSQPS